MKGLGNKKKGQKNVSKIETVTVPFALNEIKENITANTNRTSKHSKPSKPSKPSKKQLINQAFKFHSQGNISEAAKYYQYFINQGFDDHRVFANYGIILKDQNKLKEAELYTRKALELKPDFAIANYNLGVILIAIGNSQEAEQSTRKALELNPNFVEAHSNLGNILRDLGNLQDAERSTRKALELNPDFVEAHYNLGNILRDLGNLQEAEQSTRKALELNPNFAEAYDLLAKILNNLQNRDHSIKYQKKYFTLKAKDINTKSNIENVIDLFSKKIVSQDHIYTFFDNAVNNHLINSDSNGIDYSYIFESIIKSKDQRFISYKERKAITQNKRQIDDLPLIISQGTHSLINWKEYSLYKTANDMIIYSMLLNEIRPEIIIELGSGSGGSAVWMADICKSLELDCKIFSYDIKKPSFNYNNITFIEFDISKLDINEGLPLLNSLYNERILVIEDAHVNLLSVLYTVNKFLKSGDYLIIEDSQIKEKQIEKFTKNYPERFMLDQYYLDFFGTNMTCSFDSIFKVF